MLEKGTAYPGGATRWVGLWLLLLSIALTVGLILTLSSGAEQDDTTHQLMAVLLAAGMGSTISTMRGFLRHASEDGDFKDSFAPWYIGRPAMGAMLGLVFYMGLRGGLLVLMTDSDPKNLMALTSIAALVGMFSREAIDKLREVFTTLFATKKEELQDVLARLPDELKQQVLDELKSSEGAGRQESEETAATDAEEPPAVPRSV